MVWLERWLERGLWVVVGGTYVEEVKLIGGAADRVGEQEQVALHPGHLLGRELEADAGTGHFRYGIRCGRTKLILRVDCVVRKSRCDGIGRGRGAARRFKDMAGSSWGRDAEVGVGAFSSVLLELASGVARVEAG